MNMKWIWSSLIICLGILIGPSGGWGEYYQYEDPSGVVRFTDDASLIPPEQREETQIHESIVNPMSSELISDSEEDAEVSEVEGVSVEESDAQPAPASEDRVESEELDAQRKELLKLYREIEADKKALGGPPPKSAKSAVKADYEQMSRALNQKSVEYNKLSMEFEKKVKVFNSRIIKK